MSLYYITKAYFKTKKEHSNKDNEYKLINVEVSKMKHPPRVDIILDSNPLGTVPYSNKSRVKIIDPQANKIDITLGIDKPNNLDNCPFRYTMKMYQLFGKEFKIEQGNRN